MDLVGSGAGQSEVEDLGAAGALVQPDVGRLDVAVDQALFMSCSQPPGDLAADAQNLRHTQLAALIEPLVQGRAFQKLHGQEGNVAVLAYLATGVLLGPDGIGVVSEPERILAAAEIGVVMLLFVIGLELSPARLRAMRRPVFGTGGAQVAVSALLLAGALLAYGLHWKGALVAGIGLALCKRFCEMMGGGISLESEPGRGSTFTIRLPAVGVAAESHTIA